MPPGFFPVGPNPTPGIQRPSSTTAISKPSVRDPVSDCGKELTPTFLTGRDKVIQDSGAKLKDHWGSVMCINIKLALNRRNLRREDAAGILGVSGFFSRVIGGTRRPGGVRKQLAILLGVGEDWPFLKAWLPA
jgi:hypothetical protein